MKGKQPKYNIIFSRRNGQPRKFQHGKELVDFLFLLCYNGQNWWSLISGDERIDNMQRIRQKKHGSIRDFYAAAILTGCLTIFLCLLWVIHPDLIFGSTMDWNNQHIIFPDYFRSRFYQTGQLFPNFASAIGAGQNIYEFTYYGLFNPIFLLSYLLPFVPMMDYIHAVVSC